MLLSCECEDLSHQSAVATSDLPHVYDAEISAIVEVLDNVGEVVNQSLGYSR